jgi:DNA polymerase I-like protein with 3'-5' exonuclease and polymerase domains
VDSDYSTVELVALAQVCLDLFGHSAMADAINEGKDLHLVTAAQIMGIPYEEALARYTTKDPEAKEKRQLSKSLNFGFPGGMGPDAFVEFALGYGLVLDRDFVAELKQVWFDAYPEMKDYFAYISQLAGTGETFDLTQLRSGRVRGGCRYTAACNSLFQGLAADGAKRALRAIVRECFLPPLPGEAPSPLYGCLVHAFVHDEVLLSAPIARVHEAAVRLEEIMVECMRYYMPDVAVRVETEASDRWSKSAERVVDENGRLQVWTPKPPTEG